MIEFVKNPATGVREAVEVDYTKRHFHASTVSEFELEAAKISVVAAKARASFESGPLAGVAALKKALQRAEDSLDAAAEKLAKLTGESVGEVKARLVQRTPARAAAAKPAALSVHRAQLPIVAAAAVANPAGILTAAEFSQRPTMHYSEFSKMTAADKSRFVVKSRGKVVD